MSELQSSISTPVESIPNGTELRTFAETVDVPTPIDLDAAAHMQYTYENIAVDAFDTYATCTDADDYLTVDPDVWQARRDALRRSLVALGKVYKGVGLNFLGGCDSAAEAFGFDVLPGELETVISDGFSDAQVWDHASYAPDDLPEEHRPDRFDLERHLELCATMTTKTTKPVFDEAAYIEQQAQEYARALAIRERGQELFNALRNGDPTPVASLGISLCDMLDQDDEEEVYRINGLAPKDGNVIIAAQRKAGKSTMIGNLIRSLVDGDEFLPGVTPFLSDGFTVTPLVDGEKVALIDLELSPRTIRRWSRKQGIKNAHMVDVHSLRGTAAEFDLTDKKRRNEWAAQFRAQGVKVLIIDPLAPLFAVQNVDENDNMGVARILNAIDELKAAAGIEEVFIAHHMGHGAERSRGASRLRDWPDAEWFIVRENAQGGSEPPPDSARFFKAEGRDVMVPEFRLAFDAEHNRLLKAGGTRAQHSRTKNEGPAATVVTAQPGLTYNDLVKALQESHGLSQAAAKDGITAALNSDAIHRHAGPRRAQYHYPGAGCDACPPSE
jgi:hypothetical protein